MERGLEKESKRRDTRELHMVLVVSLVAGERKVRMILGVFMSVAAV